MEPDELYEASVKTSGARGALAALILAEDHEGARLRVQHMNRGDLTSLILVFMHEYVAGYVAAVERTLGQQGKEPEEVRREAREMAMVHFRVTAQMWPPGFGQQDNGED